MEYDVALSFAGEDRKYVEAVAKELKRLGVRVFYDNFESVNLWGKDLYTHLQSVYQKQAKYTVVFISEHYARKLWTNHERKMAQARAFIESREYILPARFDHTEIEGITQTVGYIDLSKLRPKEFANLIKRKTELNSTEPIEPETDSVNKPDSDKSPPNNLSEEGATKKQTSIKTQKLIGLICLVLIVTIALLYWQFIYKFDSKESSDITTYHGKVSDVSNFQAISGAKVIVETNGAIQTVNTDSEGIFRYNLPSTYNNYRVTVKADKFQPIIREMSTVNKDFLEFRLTPNEEISLPTPISSSSTTPVISTSNNTNSTTAQPIKKNNRVTNIKQRIIPKPTPSEDPALKILTGKREYAND